MSEDFDHPQEEADEMSRRFIELVLFQAQNILFILGKLPTPDGRTQKPNLDAAHVFIDQLEAIQFKTRGNLNADESRVLERALSELRLAFVDTVQALGEPIPPSMAGPAKETGRPRSGRDVGPTKETHRVKETAKEADPKIQETKGPEAAEDNPKRFIKKYS